jgi:N-acetylmuramoyl-L-alanine amidase
MRVCLDPGHGGKDPGATFRALKEKDICLEVGLRTYDLLQTNGYSAFLTRGFDVYRSISYRTSLANNWPADIFISIHTNADADPDEPGMPEAKGSEIWIHPGSVQGRKLATAISSKLPNYFPGQRWRGIKEEEFGVLHQTTMPAVLLELAFLDTAESSELANTSVQSTIAEIIYEGVKSYEQE